MTSTFETDGYRDGVAGNAWSGPGFSVYAQEYSRGYELGKADAGWRDHYNSADCEFFKTRMREALRMAASYRRAEPRNRQPYAIMWRERVADYRECLINQMRRRQGWSLAEQVRGYRARGWESV